MIKLKQKGSINLTIIVAILVAVIVSGYFVFVFRMRVAVAPMPTPTLTSSQSASLITKGCKRTGCSGQLCVGVDEQDVVTTCEFKAEYGCYQKAKCERQLGGECGFTPTAELNTCLKNAVNVSGVY